MTRCTASKAGIFTVGMLTVFMFSSPPAQAAEAKIVGTWDFQVLLDNSEIGYHRFVLREQNGLRTLISEARFQVRLLMIPAYRYTHDATEQWRGNCLVSLSAHTDDNGKKLTVEAKPGKNAGTIEIVATGIRETADGCVMSYAYWNPDILQQTRLLNAQTGEYQKVGITRLGDETLTVRGTPVTTRRYRINGAKHPVDLWYGPDQSWLALESTLESGRRLRYQLK